MRQGNHEGAIVGAPSWTEYQSVGNQYSVAGRKKN